jgi:sugar/nucleoside kinase (ribokinase family)
MNQSGRAWDVVVLGEPLIEHDSRLSVDVARVSGDAYNVAIAAAAIGAKVAILTTLGMDTDGTRVLTEFERNDVDTQFVHRVREPTGHYTIGNDDHAQRFFTYARSGSAASTMSTATSGSWAEVVRSSHVFVTSGITGALSATCRELVIATVEEASQAGVQVIFDVNYRSALTTAEGARSLLTDVASRCTLVKVGSPDDSVPVLGTTDPISIVSHLDALGAGGVVVTCGREPLILARDGEFQRYPVRLRETIDTTGAGDVLVGTLAACIANHKPLTESVQLAMDAAGESTSVFGGAPRRVGF